MEGILQYIYLQLVDFYSKCRQVNKYTIIYHNYTDPMGMSIFVWPPATHIFPSSRIGAQIGPDRLVWILEMQGYTVHDQPKQCITMHYLGQITQHYDRFAFLLIPPPNG